MPELPEVQAHAERLDAALAGRALTAFEPLSFTALKTVTPPTSAIGQPVRAVTRRGKHLLLGVGPVHFVTHLMQGGRLRLVADGTKRPKQGVARWRFDAGPDLLLTEAGTERRVGVWIVEGDPLTQPPLDDLGPEADSLDAWELAERFAAHSMRLHTFLRDQQVIAGIGRRLANEICHRARLSPFAQTKALGDVEAAAVVEAIRDLVAEGLEAERARDDMSASRERPAAVHGRTGEPCPVCGDVVREVDYRDYTVHYCATCQTGGKVLADNALSKLGVDRSEQGVKPRARSPRRSSSRRR